MMASKKQSRGVLHLAVWDGKALEIGYQSLTICDRVNAYFGFQAVHQVRCASSAPPMPTCPRLKPPFASSDPLQMANFFQQLRRQLDTDSGTEESQREYIRR